MKSIECAQRSEQWFSARRGLPTASRFDKILTAAEGKPSKSQDSLINELLAESILPSEEGVIRPPYVSPEMEYGLKLEAEARCSYELEFSPEPLKEVGFILHDSGLFGGSPDALVGENGGVEIKCPNPATHIGYLRKGVLPLDYKLQVHGHMIVTGRSWWSFFSYARHLPPFHIRVEQDDFTAKLSAELIKFCQLYNISRQQFNLMPLGACP